MSAGNKIVPVRFTKMQLHEINRQIESRNANSPGEPWTFSDFVRAACQEKLKKMRRSRGGRDLFTGNPEVDLILPDVVPADSQLLPPAD